VKKAMDFSVTKKKVEIKNGSNPSIVDKYFLERLETAKDVDGNDVTIKRLDREITKAGVNGEIQRLTTKIAQFEERKTAMEKALIEIEKLEGETK
jgi:hypothetical protein